MNEPPAPEAAPVAEAIEEDSSIEEPPAEENAEPAETTPEEVLSEQVESAGSTLKEFVIHAPDSKTRAEAHSNGMEPAAAERHAEAVLGPFLQALRAALDAHTVCVLKQEDVAFDYQVVAHANADGTQPPVDAFSTTIPLLTASMARHPVTVRRVVAVSPN